MTAETTEREVAPEGTPADAEAIRARGEGLELHTKRGLHTGKPAYEDYAPAMRNLIRASLLPKEATDADLYLLLEMAATYRLDPFARELWAVKMPGRNAGQGGYLTFMIGRDGMLAIAERHPDFKGYRSQPVYAGDQFEYEADPREMPDGTWSHVKHSWGLPNQRGELLGAWAEVYREGKPPYYFFAPLEEYDKSDNDYSPWKKQRTVMIVKCALVTALRGAFRISGLYIADEMSNALLAPKEEVARAESGEANWGEDRNVKARLVTLFNVLSDRYLPAKQRLLLEGLDDAGRVDLILALTEEAEKLGREVPEHVPLLDDEEVVASDEMHIMDDERADDPEPPVGPDGQAKLVE